MAGPHRTAHIRHRNRMLARTRRLTAWVTGGAIAAAAGLGVGFAHALPGHAAPSTAAQAALRSAGSQHVQQPARRAQSQRPVAGHGRHGHRARHLAAPASKPKSTPAPPVVSTGGS
jgi:hypothetical protein